MLNVVPNDEIRCTILKYELVTDAIKFIFMIMVELYWSLLINEFEGLIFKRKLKGSQFVILASLNIQITRIS